MIKTVVITGSSKGFGLAMGEEFINQGYHVAFSGSNAQNLNSAVSSITFDRETVASVLCDVRNRDELQNLWDVIFKKWGRIDLWINNAGIAQKAEKLWHSSTADVKNIFDTNLLGAFYGTQVAVNGMLKQGFGKVYNTLGLGSTGMIRTGLNLYGTSKHAVAHFTKAFANELKGTGIIVGTLQPGMMVTDFVNAADGSIYNKSKVQNIYNILGDLPDAPAKYLVKKMIHNNTNGKLLTWLSKTKVIFRFIKHLFVKRSLFKSDAHQK